MAAVRYLNGKPDLMNAIDFTFSDLVAGYVTTFDATADRFGLKTADGREY